MLQTVNLNRLFPAILLPQILIVLPYIKFIPNISSDNWYYSKIKPPLILEIHFNSVNYLIKEKIPE